MNAQRRVLGVLAVVCCTSYGCVLFLLWFLPIPWLCFFLCVPHLVVLVHSIMGTVAGSRFGSKGKYGDHGAIHSAINLVTTGDPGDLAAKPDKTGGRSPPTIQASS